MCPFQSLLGRGEERIEEWFYKSPNIEEWRGLILKL